MPYKLNPFTGEFDLVNPENFSYNCIKIGTALTIPLYQQMIVRGRLEVAGRITIIGRLSII